MQNNACFGDKEILTDALHAEKEATKLYNTCANECAHPELRNVLMSLLNEEHDLQFEVFNAMHARGMYPTPAAEQTKIEQTRQTFAAQATN
nr:spore coat protein [bacterium]